MQGLAAIDRTEEAVVDVDQSDDLALKPGLLEEFADCRSGWALPESQAATGQRPRVMGSHGRREVAQQDASLRIAAQCIGGHARAARRLHVAHGRMDESWRDGILCHDARHPPGATTHLVRGG